MNITQTIAGMIRAVGHSSAALLWPPYCLTCDALLQEEERLVCEICWRTFRPLRGGIALHKSDLHTVGRVYFDGAKALYEYTDRSLTLIHSLKYDRKPLLAGPIGRALADVINQQAALRNCDYLLPVPLHPARQRERTYNQSHLLAVAACPKKVPDHEIFHRIRDTRAQAGLPREQRLANIQDSFAVPDPDIISGKSILLLDDVMTTGLTMNECAKTLKQSGAAQVQCIAVIHPPLEHDQGPF
jgi:competence protein ComFC